MGPLFTSRDEWREMAPRGKRPYVSSGVGHMVRAAALGLGFLVVVVGSTEPHWRSLPVLAIAAGSLAASAVGAAALFRREWHAAEEAYGPVAE